MRTTMKYRTMAAAVKPLKSLMQFPDFADKPTVREDVKVMKARRLRCVTKAKTLTQEQFDRVIAEIETEPYAERNSAIMHLSFYAGLRAQEIAGLQWKRNILDQEGNISDVIHITRDIGKRSKDRMIPTAAALRKALNALYSVDRGLYVILPIYDRALSSERAAEMPNQVHPNTLAQYMRRTYQRVGYNGCTSHSGRRTFITGLARRCNLEKGSLRDVQLLAGHTSIETTAGYIEESPHQAKLVTRVFA